ncbi:DUF5684 domain-containing protein [Clostridium sardiniense]|uniref:DUF5684 domain-containing protein n=1 Tax=Clostridium sardiniense TaxID=29369 RepID=UPI003D3249E1
MIENFDYDMFYSTSILGVSFILLVTMYVISAYPLYKMAKKADLKNKWVMWIPIINTFKLYNLAGVSGWLVWLTFIPFIGWVIAIIVLYKIFSNFGVGLLGSILGIVFSVIGFWYLALSSRKFIADIDPKYREE